MEKSNLINMNKRDLKKLSKSELIKLLLKQEKKPKIIVVDDTKQIDKPKKKQKKVYNHDNLFDDNPFRESPFDKTLRKVNKHKKILINKHHQSTTNTVSCSYMRKR